MCALIFEKTTILSDDECIIMWVKFLIEIRVFERRTSIRSHTHIQSHIKSTNQHSKHQTKNLNYVSLRSVSLSDLSASMTFSESATATSDSASMTSYERVRTSISVSSLQRHQKRMRSILYIFAVNITGDEPITS